MSISGDRKNVKIENLCLELCLELFGKTCDLDEVLCPYPAPGHVPRDGPVLKDQVLGFPVMLFRVSCFAHARV